MSNEFSFSTNILKFDPGLGIAIGFAVICKDGGKDYFDVQGDHIPESAMLAAATDFMLNSRVGKTMHAGDKTGDVVFAFPLTTDIAKSLGIRTEKTGLLIGFKPSDEETLEKLAKGEFTGFSIGGQYITNVEAD
jgi:hypothetical protein